jgi:hypothetical protein
MAITKLITNSITSGAIANTPAFEAYASSTQTGLSDGVWTKLTIDTELFDTDGYYDNVTNYRFTPLIAGKYFVYVMSNMDSVTIWKANALSIAIYKNGTEYINSHLEVNASNNVMDNITGKVSSIIEFNGSSDYVEGYININNASGGAGIANTTQGIGNFGAYKIIE